MPTQRFVSLCTLILGALLRTAALGQDSVSITEFMARNKSTLADEDGDYADWIELHNDGSVPVNLEGWHLTDDPGDLGKWTFPAVNLPASGWLVVFASGKDRALAGSPLHTNFSLDGNGEYLALIRPDRTIASQFAPAYPQQVEDVSYGTGLDVTISPAVTTGAPASALVPADGSLGTSWTGAGFDDSTWNSTLARQRPSLVITEAGSGEPAFVEVQNVSTEPLDTTGWVVAISAGTPGNPSAANGTLWSLPASLAPGEILYRTDSVTDHYWGSDIAWSPGGNGWVMIVDNNGKVADFTAWGYSAADIAGLNLTVNGHVIGAALPITVAGYEYEGDGPIAHGISSTYPDLNGTLLTDGNLGSSDWRNGYAGCYEPSAQGDSGRFQPRVTFDLGSLRTVRSVSISYMVDHSANIYAPDQVSVSFSTGGAEGAFAGTVVSTAFDDTPDSNPTTYFGDRRTLTINLGGAAANAVRLDFLNDRSWTFLSEISFTASATIQNWSGDGAPTDATAGVSFQRQGSVDRNDATDFLWQPASVGLANTGLTTPFPLPPVVTGLGYEQANGFQGAFATDLLAAMQGLNASVYLRVPFPVTQSDTHAARLRMKYDGGFIAYLNGQEIARRNAPALPTWNSSATAARSPADALVFTTIDLPLASPLPLGTNVLAIHGLNDSANSPNFLLVPELDVARPTGAGQIPVYFSTPTPGQANTSGLPEIAPAPVFSQSSGIQFAAFALSISAPDPLAQIHYTLDGSEPTTAAPLYTAPLPVNATTLVKARAFRDGRIPSPIQQRSYLFMDATLAQRDSDVPLVILDTMGQSIPGGGGAWASLVTALIDTDATGRSHMTNAPAFLGRGGMHIRGSSSTVWPKKNYSFETRDSAGNDMNVSAFGFPADSDWVLYATYLDRTLLRDSLVYDLANQFGLYSPRTRPVEVYLNTGGGVINESDYVGVFIFEERIKRGAHRVDVAKLAPSQSTEPDISGGYILKIDRGTATIPATLSRDFVPVDPEDAQLTPVQRTWMSDYIAQFESALSGPQFADPTNGYARYIDVPSWIDYHIMTEVTFNVDEWYLSTYFSKDRNGKLKLGPFWDFDRSLGNTSQVGAAGTTGWYFDALVNFFANYWGLPPDQIVEYPWFRRLFQDPDFSQQYVDRYQELRRTVLSETNINATIDRLVSERLESQARNFQRWNTLNAIISPSPLAFPTYQQHVDNLKSWIMQRLAWIDGHYLPGPSFNQDGGEVPDGFEVTLFGAGGTIYFTTDGSDPRAPGGAVAATAQAYDSPITITETTSVLARIFNGSVWSGLRKAVFYTPQNLSRLVLTEIMYHPPAFGALSGDEVEFLEFKNTGPGTLNLSTLTFTAGINFTFPNGTRLAPGEFFVLASNPAAFASKYPGVAVNGVYSGKLDNGGETVRLSTQFGGTVLSVTYNDRAPWPLAGDGYGFSIVPKSGAPFNSDDGASWRASSALGGSPGADDPEPAVPPVLVNEILTHTDPPEVDWIELFNPNAVDVDLGGWFLSDDGGWPTKYRIASGTMILAGGYLVFSEEDFNAMPGAPDSFALDSAGDSVYLASGDANGNLTGYSHGFSFGAAANGVSFGRYLISTGEEQFPAQTATTPGSDNAGPRVGPVVMSEIQYHPDSSHDEFVELRNITGGEVPLFDTAYPSNTWRLNGLAFDFPTDVTLAADGRLLIVGIDPATFREKYGVPPGVIVLGPFAGNLQDSGERLELQQPDAPGTNGVAYITVDEVRYNDRAPWPPGADGGGPSLQRIAVSAYGNDPINWEAALPTPGADFVSGPVPNITSHPQNQTIAAHQSVTFTVTAGGSGPLFYQWLFNNNPLLGQTNATLDLTDVQPSQAGHYRAVIYNPFGSVTSDEAQLTVLNLPLILLAPQSLITNSGATVVFTVTAQGTGSLRYQWRFNGSDLPGANESSLTLTNVQAANAGSYSVVVEDDIGTTQSQPAALEILQPPSVVSQPVSQAVMVGDPAYFEVTVTGTVPVAYRWRRGSSTVVPFSRGSNSFTIQAVTTFDAGSYTVAVTNIVSSQEVLSAAAVLTVLADSDGDKLPDVWETAHQFNPNVPGEAEMDTDGDGLSNREEYLAGTDPRDKESYLKIERIFLDPSDPAFEFQALAGKTYAVEWKDAPGAAAWSRWQRFIARATNRWERVMVPSPRPSERYYRLLTPSF
jgi:CotH kinase protein/Fn3 associated/Lamin Tail Domain/Immunoglobulin domain/Chitobiase/beta-hexosaminidase C-terminal domain/Bacterial TSP3 repeat